MNQFTMPIRGDKLSVNVQVTAHLDHRISEFQTIDVYETEVLGRALLLDGHIQLTTFDERAYHESLVHVCGLSVPSLKRALVIGGGDGGVIRELCRYPEIDRIDMVEIDEQVIASSREHLPSVSNGAFDDPRVHLHIGDAFEYVKRDMDPYQLIISDSTDVYEGEEGNLSEMLFTSPFYADVKRLLDPEGFVVTQADNLVFCPYSLEEIRAQFDTVFPRTGWYQAVVPSFGGFSGFCWASHGVDISQKLPAAPFELSYLNDVTWTWAQTALRFA
jgi:spermidine synthase